MVVLFKVLSFFLCIPDISQNGRKCTHNKNDKSLISKEFTRKDTSLRKDLVRILCPRIHRFQTPVNGKKTLLFLYRVHQWPGSSTHYTPLQYLGSVLDLGSGPQIFLVSDLVSFV